MTRNLGAANWEVLSITGRFKAIHDTAVTTNDAIATSIKSHKYTKCGRGKQGHTKDTDLKQILHGQQVTLQVKNYFTSTKDLPANDVFAIETCHTPVMCW